MEKIKIITDSTSDISKEAAKENDICVISQSIIFGDDVYKETQLAPDEFYEKLEAFDGTPKTAQISVSDVVSVYEEFIDHTMIFITISKKGSGTHQVAHMAKDMVLEDHPNADITIIDGESFSYGYGMWVLMAAKMAKEGKTKEEIIKAVEEKIKVTQVLFAVNTLEYLKKGGRLSPTAKIIADVLDIKPILKIEDGLVMTKEKVRGSKKIYSKMAEMVLSNADDIENQRIVLLHGNDIQKANLLLEALNKKVNITNYEVQIVGPSVGTHAGPGVIGIAYTKKA